MVLSGRATSCRRPQLKVILRWVLRRLDFACAWNLLKIVDFTYTPFDTHPFGGDMGFDPLPSNFAWFHLLLAFCTGGSLTCLPCKIHCFPSRLNLAYILFLGDHWLLSVLLLTLVFRVASLLCTSHRSDLRLVLILLAGCYLFPLPPFDFGTLFFFDRLGVLSHRVEKVLLFNEGEHLVQEMDVFCDETV